MLTIATHNTHKFKEISAILNPLTCQDCSHLQTTPAEETGLTFIENALIKARSIAQIAKTPCIADDSGLVVPALGGKPGIYSSRFSGTHATDKTNREYLLTCMQDIPDKLRQAYFYCAIVYIEHVNDPTPIIALGQWHGQILTNEYGENGFGYDSLFYVPSHKLTAAQMSAEEKNKISHRAQALIHLKNQLNIIG